MLRSSLFVFIAGWVAWFWIDKPRAGPFKLPPPDDSLVENFQRAFDILKAGYLDLAFVYIWNAHYLLLSLLGGAVIAVAYGSVSGHFSRRRLRKLMVPERKQETQVSAAPDHPDPVSPSETQKANGVSDKLE
jgi:hypothetical protein